MRILFLRSHGRDVVGVVGGLGKARTKSLKLRPATPDDARRIFAWRNDPWLVSRSTSQLPVSWEEHSRWFERVLTDHRHLLLIIEPEPGIAAGTVRLDRIDDSRAVVTIYLLREFTGQGFGARALVDACSRAFAGWSIHTIHAHIRKDNHPSFSAFVKAGFVRVGSDADCPKDHCGLVLHRGDTPYEGNDAS